MTQTDLQPFLDGSDKLPRTTTLSKEKGLRTLLLHLNAGEQIPEHQTKGAITVHCLKGHATFVSGTGKADLSPASVVALAPDVPHSVIAQQETLLLVTMSEAIPAA